MLSEVGTGRTTSYGYAGHAEMGPCFYRIADSKHPRPVRYYTKNLLWNNPLELP